MRCFMEVERNIPQRSENISIIFPMEGSSGSLKHGISLVIPGTWAPASDEPKRQGPRNQHTGFLDDV